MAQERLKRRNAKRKAPKTYHVKTTKKDGSSGWHGTKDLATSAVYPAWFAAAVCDCWSQAWIDFSLGHFNFP